MTLEEIQKIFDGAEVGVYGKDLYTFVVVHDWGGAQTSSVGAKNLESTLETLKECTFVEYQSGCPVFHKPGEQPE